MNQFLRLLGWGKWVLAAGMLGLALTLKSVYWMPIREYETGGLLVLSLFLGLPVFINLLQKQSGRGNHLGQAVFLILLVVVVGATLWGEARFRSNKLRVQNADPERLRRLGRHVILGYERPEEVRDLIKQGAIRGIFVTGRNVNGRDREAMRREIADFQALWTAAGHPGRLIVAADQEGGPVSRLSPPLPAPPPLSSFVSGKKPWKDRLRQMREHGEAQGRELTSLGINVNFSPVVDLTPEPRLNLLDFHTQINLRTISSNENVVSQAALAYAQGLEKSGVIPTLKHFPGLGRVTSDTHHFSATLDVGTETLEAKDWRPFREVSAGSSAFMMIGHVVLATVDPLAPASGSKPVIQGIIRQGWRYQGVLITDDMCMGSAGKGRGGLGGAAVAALQAGVDLLLISYDGEKYYDLMAALLEADIDGRLDRSWLAEEAARVQRVTGRVWRP